ncbi:MAG: hypothetical protein AMJ65_13975 [Phycisphaerae bacterium SG8_4]|nr:MAG: hypothetical protein AMJ65_13975 [Phycisphaerae bacterium SG8_4]KPL23655.1 MAG: hypothetical protein AMJ75_05685 [Phycisphaerae bacterium SM1_79]
MQEHTKVETLDYIDDDLATAPLLEEMRGFDGKPRICEKVWTCREFNVCLYEVCLATHLKDSSDLRALPEL